MDDMEIKQKLQMIQDLMGQVVDSMEPDHEDFMSRLGKKPKAVVAIKIGEKPDDMSDDDSQLEPGQPDEAESMDESMAESTPDDELKKRLMKLRK